MSKTIELINNNLFDFWSLIGEHNNLYQVEAKFKLVHSQENNWPNVLYDVHDLDETEVREIITKINSGVYPNHLVTSSEILPMALSAFGFEVSRIEYPYAIDLESFTPFEGDDSLTIELVDAVDQLERWCALLKTTSGVSIPPNMLAPFLGKRILKPVLAKNNEKEVGVALMFFDMFSAGFRFIQAKNNDENIENGIRNLVFKKALEMGYSTGVYHAENENTFKANNNLTAAGSIYHLQLKK